MPSTSKSNPRKPKSRFDPKPKHQWRVREQKRNWLELPSDVMANILYRVGVFDILENAQKVCTTWRKICKDPAMWRVINMDNHSDPCARPPLREMCKHAVDRSQGQLVGLTIEDFADHELLLYIADRSSQLRSLDISCCYGGFYEGWTEILKEFPLLEELSLYRTDIAKEDIEGAGHCCPMLTTLKVNQEFYRFCNEESDEEFLMTRNETAIAIGENLPELRHLELIGNSMSNIGLQAILDGCRHLESLDLRQCLNIDLEGDLGKKCSEKFKCLKLPNDSLEDYPYICRYGDVTRDVCTPKDFDYDYSDYKYYGYSDFDDYTFPHTYRIYDSDNDSTEFTLPSTSKDRRKRKRFKSKPKQQWQVNQYYRDWLKLPSDVMANILYRIGVHDILENAQKVCTTWRKICKDPAMWRVIHMNNTFGDTNGMAPVQEMCRHAVDRSQGQLVDLTVVDFADDELLKYIVDRSSQLRRLEFACCYGEVYDSWPEALIKLPLLEELNLYLADISIEAIDTVGRCCPMLRTLKINQETATFCNDDIALAIGRNLPELKHLELVGHSMSNTGLQVILDGCRHLESLDLRQCLSINLKGDLGKKCFEKIKCLKLPSDTLEGCPYIYKSPVVTYDSGSESEDFDYDYSDDEYDWCFDYDDYTVPHNYRFYEEDDDFY